MTQGAEARARNQRVASLLVATIVGLCCGSALYIDWFHADGARAAMTRAK